VVDNEKQYKRECGPRTEIYEHQFDKAEVEKDDNCAYEHEVPIVSFEELL
jgi:hypothetical protein